MSYCTSQDMIDRYRLDELIQLTDAENAGIIDETVIATAIERGGSLIDSYCRGRYQIPLLPVDPLIIDINADLARYHLYDDQAPEQVQRNHDEAETKLRQIATNTLKLTAAPVVSGSSSGSAQFENDGRVFGRDNSRGF